MADNVSGSVTWRRNTSRTVPSSLELLQALGLLVRESGSPIQLQTQLFPRRVISETLLEGLGQKLQRLLHLDDVASRTMATELTPESTQLLPGSTGLTTRDALQEAVNPLSNQGDIGLEAEQLRVIVGGHEPLTEWRRQVFAVAAMSVARRL
jgi:predicted component of type VI protein secretion system